jgi:two-component system CheB/CheR fusion protein
MNHVASSLIGWTAEEAEGRDLGEIFNIVNEESGDAVESPVLKVIREGATVGLANHTVLISRDGRHTPIDDSAAPIRDHMGRIVGVVMVFHDITERRQAERERAGLLGEVERGRERLTNIIRTIPGVVWETWGEPDAATQKTDFISDYVETMLGYTVEEWLATPRFWLVVTHPDDRERVERDSAERYRQGINGVSQFRWIRKDGRVIWVESRSTVTRDDEGRPIGLRGVSMDITATKEAEIELLAAKEEAESANQAKDQFLAVLSHELRTPLTPVLAITQVLENSDELSDELRPIIEMVRRNVELEARLIDDLLDLTRVSKGKLQLNMETVDIHAHLANVLEMCQSDIRGKELAITIDLEARRYHAQADPARIQQVFWNLVKNAVKFTPKGGEITVTSFNNERGDLVVEVTDTGIGIEPELVPKIFDAFEQGSQSITRQYGGLGLGLAISRALVEMHGGTLSAVSQGEGSGSKFVMEIATVDPPVAGQTRRNGDNGELHGTRIGRILLVDDHIETSTVLKLLLERRGYTVETAHTVADALALALAGEFDILISDIGLPDGSGLDLMRAIRREKDLPGIALSGFGMEEDLERSREAGFAAHLTKPVGFQRLQDAISKVLAG